MDTCSIKRIKATNQLKVSFSSNAFESHSLLSECRLKHLVASDTFTKYFDFACNTQKLVSLANFYIIEENSFFGATDTFSCNQSDPKKMIPTIVNTHRKIRHFRRLSDFEVVLLLFKSLGHLISNSQVP